MLIFMEDEIRRSVQLDQAVLSEIKTAFSSLVTKEVQMPPTMRVDIPNNNGEVVMKTAYIPDFEMFAVKISSGFFNNYSLGLPSMGGLMLLMNSLNGKPEAILYDNGYLTDVRTAAAGAIAADYMAKTNVHRVGVIGAGTQAQFQLRALKQVRNFDKVFVHGLSQRNMRDLKETIESELNVQVFLKNNSQDVVENSELVITATPSEQPIVKREWVQDGTHITAVGADARYKQELDSQLFVDASLIVCDVVEQCRDHGELHHVVEKGLLPSQKRIYELGELVIAGKVQSQHESGITIADLTGTGVQDTQIALYAYKKLTEEK